MKPRNIEWVEMKYSYSTNNYSPDFTCDIIDKMSANEMKMATQFYELLFDNGILIDNIDIELNPFNL